jgi:putative transposase
VKFSPSPEVSRPLRCNIPGALYHVTSRGNDRQDIVRQDSDREVFVDLLARVTSDRQWVLHAWVLMSNHLHLVVETPHGNLSAGMRDLLGRFASRFNAVHRRSGHLFQSRFHARLVERETHLLELVRYLPLNPVRCGLVLTPAEWPWSSYRATAGLDPPPTWLEVDATLSEFHRTDQDQARAGFRQFVSKGHAVAYSPAAESVNGWILGSPSFCDGIQRWIDSTARTHEHPRRQRHVVALRLDSVIELVVTELAVDPSEVRRRRQGPIRKLIAELGHAECGITFDAIGQALGTSPWGAAKLRARSLELERLDPHYAHLLARLRRILRSRDGG